MLTVNNRLLSIIACYKLSSPESMFDYIFPFPIKVYEAPVCCVVRPSWSMSSLFTGEPEEGIEQGHVHKRANAVLLALHAVFRK
jgi:hypothetical protein